MLARCPHCQAYRNPSWAVCPVCGQCMHAVAMPGPMTTSAAEPLTPYYPCVVCGNTKRWDDHGIWRCMHCWPEALAPGALRAEAAYQARREAQAHATRILE